MDYWNQVLVNILYSIIPEKDPPDPIRYSTSRYHSRNILLLLVLMAASTKAAVFPIIDLSGEKMLNTKLRKTRGKDDMLRICNLSSLEMWKVRDVLESLTSDLIKNGYTKPIILDTGCSRSPTGFRDDFVEGTLVHLCHTYLIYGIDAYLESAHGVTLHYEVINNEWKF